MNIEAEILAIRKSQERIDGKLTSLLSRSQKQTWIKVSFITSLTGWSSTKLDQARKQGIIKFRKSKENGIEYLLESLSEIFIIKKAI